MDSLPYNKINLINILKSYSKLKEQIITTTDITLLCIILDLEKGLKKLNNKIYINKKLYIINKSKLLELYFTQNFTYRELSIIFNINIRYIKDILDITLIELIKIMGEEYGE